MLNLLRSAGPGILSIVVYWILIRVGGALVMRSGLK